VLHDPTVVTLSELVGRPVVAPDGRRVGKVADLTVGLGPPHPAVRRLLVRDRRRTAHLVGCADLAEDSSARVVLAADLDHAVRVDVARPRLDPGELLLAWDVLDTQVVDVRGHRLSRVSEVFLHRTGARLEVVAVDLGSAGLLRLLRGRRFRRTAGWRVRRPRGGAP
jgi:sporulation protein YlmC with PRC-barrel domain